MPKRATAVILSEKEQEGLTQITKRHRSEQQVVLRAHIVLLAAQRSSNAHIARELGVNVDTVRLWRGARGGCRRVHLGAVWRGRRRAAAAGSGGEAQVSSAQT